MSIKSLIINPGSTSTKIGVFEDETLLFEETLRHSTEEIAQYATIVDQKDFRKNIIIDLLKEKGYTTYKIRQEKLIGQGTLTAIKNGTGGLDAKTIARLCEVLECQPGDLMEYVSEEKPGE